MLLDTHALLWALMEPAKLSPRARDILKDPANTVFVSPASAWEIATQHRLGRLPVAESVVRGYLKHLATLMAAEVPITAEHALLAGSLAAEHRDPFDRMLAAQALVEGVPLLTADPAFSALRVETVW